MKTIAIAENIRSYRKLKGMTQERLAQIMDVSVGAVSKWESGASVPDVGMIMELAEFFETSVDVLLGYEWKKGGMGEAAARIIALRDEKRFDEAATETETALERYPNSFDVTFAGAVMYSMRGVETHAQKSYARALTLFERAKELISQNTNEQINEWTINNHIANVYLCMGQTDRALERMKCNNAGGTNNISIGYTLAHMKNAPEEALPYLTNGLIDNVSARIHLAQGYAAAYRKLGRHAEAYAILLWISRDLAGLSAEDAPCIIDRMLAQSWTACAAAAARAGDEAGAREALGNAVRSAKRFDAAPKNDFTGMRFYEGGAKHRIFDDFGTTTLDGIRNMTASEEDVGARLNGYLEEILDG